MRDLLFSYHTDGSRVPTVSTVLALQQVCAVHVQAIYQRASTVITHTLWQQIDFCFEKDKTAKGEKEKIINQPERFGLLLHLIN